MESSSEYEKRIRRGSYVEENVRRGRRKGLFVVLAILLAALVLAVGVGIYTYFKSTDARLGLSSSNAAEALVEAEPGEPYYILCTAQLADVTQAKKRTSDDAIMLVRVDEAAKAVSFVTIPSQVRLQFPDDGYYSLDGYPEEMGDAGLVKAVSNLAGVDISHFVTTSAAQISSMVDAVGGVDVEISQEIDDPNAGIYVLRFGSSTLGGAQALVYLRATNLTGGFSATAANRVEFTMGVLAKALDSQGIGFANIVSEASKYIGTDLTASEILDMGNKMRPVDSMTCYSCVVPYVENTSQATGEKVASVVTSKWEQMLQYIKAGEDPANAEKQIGDVASSEVSVEVRNGAGIDGAAASLASTLEGLGYQIGNVGNVEDGTIFPETLIIYTSAEFEDAAMAIVRDTGVGRVVNGGDYYSSDSDVIAIIGLDWSA